MCASKSKRRGIVRRRLGTGSTVRLRNWVKAVLAAMTIGASGACVFVNTDPERAMGCHIAPETTAESVNDFATPGGKLSQDLEDRGVTRAEVADEKLTMELRDGFTQTDRERLTEFLIDSGHCDEVG